MTVVSQEEKNIPSGKNRGANISANDFLCLGAFSGEENKNEENQAIVHCLWLLLNT